MIIVRSFRKFLFLVLLSLFDFIGCGGGGENGPSLNPTQQEIVTALSQACTGVRIENTAVYTRTPRIHPLVLLNSEGKQHEWTTSVPSEWWPESVEATELVACVGEGKDSIEICRYVGGPDITRYVFKVGYMIWETQSGRLINQGSLTGDPPRDCRSSEPVDLTELNGSRVSFDQLLPLLKPFVDLSDRTSDPFNTHAVATFPVGPTGLTIGVIDNTRYLWIANHPIEGNIFMYEYLLGSHGTIITPGSTPRGLAFDGTYLWTADASEDKIYKLEASTLIVDSFDTPVPTPRGLAFDGTYLWTVDASEDKIYKLDTSGNIIDSFDSPGPYPGALAFDGTYLWTADGSEAKLFKLDTSGNIIDSFDSPGASALAFDGAYLWIANGSENKLYRLDTSGNIIDSIDFVGYSDSIGLAFDGTNLWIPGFSSPHPYRVIHKLDASGNILNSIYTPTLQPSGLAFDGTYLWAIDSDKGKIYKMDIFPNIIASFDSPVPAPSALAFDGTYLWIANGSESQLFRLDTSGDIIGSIDSPGPSPSALAFDGTYLWTADSSEGKLYRLDTSGNIIDSINSPGPSPSGLAFNIPYLYVADYEQRKMYELTIE
jgi:DNA-binding beta-propeller fold protein YncE